MRVTERILNGPLEKHHLLQQVQKQTVQMQERTIIDGQQRLTTLQLLLDALHAELLSVQALQPAMRIEPLVTNAEPFGPRTASGFGPQTATGWHLTLLWTPSLPTTGSIRADLQWQSAAVGE